MYGQISGSKIDVVVKFPAVIWPWRSNRRWSNSGGQIDGGQIDGGQIDGGQIDGGLLSWPQKYLRAEAYYSGMINSRNDVSYLE